MWALLLLRTEWFSFHNVYTPDTRALPPFSSYLYLSLFEKPSKQFRAIEPPPPPPPPLLTHERAHAHAHMSEADIASLAKLLDKNAAFTRPAGQTTGFSLKEATEGAAGTAAVAASSAPGTVAANPASIAVPSTVVDRQLGLPVPSHSAAAKEQQRREQTARVRRPCKPPGNALWSQAELQTMYERQVQQGPAPLAAAARAAKAPAAASATAMPTAPANAVEPVHRVLYQERVSAEDVYLGVDFTRDHSSASSDGVVVWVELPGMKQLSDIAVRVEPYELVVSAGEYFLRAPLPRKVVGGAADAQWNATEAKLVVRMAADHSEDRVQLL